VDALERIEEAVTAQGQILARVDERTRLMKDAFEREVAALHHRVGEVKENCDRDASRLDKRVDELAARPVTGRGRVVATTGGGVVGTLGLVQVLDWFKDPHNAAWLKRLLGIS